MTDYIQTKLGRLNGGSYFALIPVGMVRKAGLAKFDAIRISQTESNSIVIEKVVNG